MQITYRDNRIERVCTDYSAAKKVYDVRMAAKIHQRIREIEQSENVEMMIRFRIGRCHLLKGDRQGEYAIDLVHPYRLVFIKRGDKIQIAEIMEIVDYH